MTIEAPTYSETLQKKGHIQVGKKREAIPVNLYYEIHGSGQEKVVLVMGKAFLFVFII